MKVFQLGNWLARWTHEKIVTTEDSTEVEYLVHTFVNILQWWWQLQHYYYYYYYYYYHHHHHIILVVIELLWPITEFQGCES